MQYKIPQFIVKKKCKIIQTLKLYAYQIKIHACACFRALVAKRFNLPSYCANRDCFLIFFSSLCALFLVAARLR